MCLDSRSLDDLGWLSYIVLGVWIINGVLILFLLAKIDSIVHGQLYGYGLQFSHDWDDHFGASVNLILIFMIVPLTLSALVLGIRLAKNMKLNRKYISKFRIRREKVVADELKPREEPVVTTEAAVAENAPSESEPTSTGY